MRDLQGDALVSAIKVMFERQMVTTKVGMKLRGSMDAAQHELLTKVFDQFARNMAQALVLDEEG